MLYKMHHFLTRAAKLAEKWPHIKLMTLKEPFLGTLEYNNGSHLDAILHLGNLCPAEQPFDSPKSNDRLGRSSFAKKLGLRCDSLSLAMETSPDDYRIQSFDLDTQMLLKTALKDPSSVNLDKVSSVIVDQSLKDQVFSKEAGRICYTIVQAEAKQSNGNVFRRNLLNRLQQEFKNREATRGRSLQEWVCYVTFICNIFDYLKVNNMPMVALVHPVFDCLTRLAQPDALVNEEEVDCLVLQLHRIGEQLEKVNNQRMDELFFLLRDGFLLQEGLTSMARLLLLEILEFRAGGWLLSGTAHKYYYSEIAD